MISILLTDRTCWAEINLWNLLKSSMFSMLLWFLIQSVNEGCHSTENDGRELIQNNNIICIFSRKLNYFNSTSKINLFSSWKTRIWWFDEELSHVSHTMCNRLIEYLLVATWFGILIHRRNETFMSKACMNGGVIFHYTYNSIKAVGSFNLALKHHYHRCVSRLRSLYDVGRRISNTF